MEVSGEGLFLFGAFNFLKILILILTWCHICYNIEENQGGEREKEKEKEREKERELYKKKTNGLRMFPLSYAVN